MKYIYEDIRYPGYKVSILRILSILTKSPLSLGLAPEFEEARVAGCQTVQRKGC